MVYDLVARVVGVPSRASEVHDAVHGVGREAIPRVDAPVVAATRLHGGRDLGDVGGGKLLPFADGHPGSPGGKRRRHHTGGRWNEHRRIGSVDVGRRVGAWCGVTGRGFRSVGRWSGPSHAGPGLVVPPGFALPLAPLESPAPPPVLAWASS